MSKPSTISAGPAIRAVRFPQDKPAILSFIDGIQRFESPFEPDRRVDDAVAQDYFPEVTRLLEEKSGTIFLAEQEGTALGWALVYRDQNEIYVVEQERDIATIRELYVIESARGQGVGKALIAACEDWARAQGLRVVLIGMLSANTNADAAYRKAGFSPYALYLRKYLP